MSKVGITTFVKVWCNLVSLNSFLRRLCRYFPSYFGPVKALNRFPTEAKIPLWFQPTKEKMKASHNYKGTVSNQAPCLETWITSHTSFVGKS